MSLIIILFAVLFLAFSNGANDNFKGVATLFGSKTSDYKTAIFWATITTLSGSLAAVFLAEALVTNFSGKGLVPDEFLQNPAFAVSVSFGAATAVFIATKIGMPVSTTHGLVGAMIGSGLLIGGSSLNFTMLVNIFLLPLIIIPVLAALFGILFYSFFHKLRIIAGITKKTCVCVGDELVPVLFNRNNEAATEITAGKRKTITIKSENDCIKIYNGRFAGVSVQKLLDYSHFISAGAVGFARGLNDTPKIVGLLLLFNGFGINYGIFAASVAIAAGGLFQAKKVAKTMSFNITKMNHGQGFTANLVTSLLVFTASIFGLPVSTTHVSVGSISGIGTITGQADKREISKIILAWLFTLPVAAIFSVISYLMFGVIF
ncbi:MAG: inorganic phosphate transporter [Ignavibacteriaceae bacterium]